MRTSSSSPDACTSIQAWFERSLGLLRDGDPAAYRECVLQLGELTLEIHMPGEQFWLRARPGELLCDSVGPVTSRATISSDPDTLAELVERDLTLLEALRSDRLLVRAAPATLTRLEVLASVYLHAAVRLPKLRELWNEFVSQRVSRPLARD